MIRRVSLLLFVGCVAAFLAVAADLPDRWRPWRYSRAILQDPSSQDGTENTAPALIHLPWDLFAHCNPGCSDLRITDNQGQEVPFELKIDHGSQRSESHDVHVMENSFAAGRYTQIVGDLGSETPSYDRVRIDTPLSDFIVWAEVALSDDAKTWRVVEPRAPIARFRKRSVDGTQTIPFHGLNSRYIRVRIFETGRQFDVTSLTVLREESHPATLVEVPTTFQVASSDDTTETEWSTNPASANIPLSRIQFATETPEFYRAVRISGSDDGKVWNYRGSGVIYRYKQASTVRESLSVDFLEWPGNRLLRVDVINGNDQPLRNPKLSLLAVPRSIVFRPQPNGNYRVLYGNDRVDAPQYDLSHFLEAAPTKPLYVRLSLGPEEATANYQDSRPFSERHSSVLWIALGIAIVLIALTALKTLRTPSPPSSGNPV